MIICDDKTLAWLEHRGGFRELAHHPAPVSKRALELSRGGDDFAAKFGCKEIKGCVGFVDLADFSNRVANFSPKEISAYLQPFLSGVIEAVRKAGGLVDKTIGDEVMLVLPDMEEDGGIPVIFNLQFLLSLLDELQSTLGRDYPFHLGLSYGRLYIDRVSGNGYGEWTLAGKSVILAKRLSTLPTIDSCDLFSGGFGVLGEETTNEDFASMLRYIAGDVSRLDHKLLDCPTLKGISSARCAAFTRKGSTPSQRNDVQLS